MDQQALKRAVAKAALEFIAPDLQPGRVIGIGTGSTVDLFIDVLAERRHAFRGGVASSARTEARLRERGIAVLDMADVDTIPVYVDGADEATREFALLKGGGGALTREKIVAASAERFVCIVDGSKMVERLGNFPLPVEIVPMARGHVTRALTELGAPAAGIVLRRDARGEPFVSDNHNWILDVAGLDIEVPERWEEDIDRIVGVVSNGLFARRGADVLLVGEAGGVTQSLRPPHPV